MGKFPVRVVRAGGWETGAYGKDDREDRAEELQRTRDYVGGEGRGKWQAWLDDACMAHQRILFWREKQRVSISHGGMKITECSSRGVKRLTYMYRGPSVSGKRCDPRTLPHWPMAMNIGMPVALFVSDPRLCATKVAA